MSHQGTHDCSKLHTTLAWVSVHLRPLWGHLRQPHQPRSAGSL